MTDQPMNALGDRLQECPSCGCWTHPLQVEHLGACRFCWRVNGESNRYIPTEEPERISYHLTSHPLRSSVKQEDARDA